MKNFQDKTAFVTGGASGIGLGTTKVFVKNGMRVVIADMRQSALDEAVAWFKENGGEVYPINLNVTDREAYAKAADEAESVFGNIHVLFNNAGVGMGGTTAQTTFKDWDYGMGVNIGGVINGVLTMLPRMLKHGEEGHIVSTSSAIIPICSFSPSSTYSFLNLNFLTLIFSKSANLYVASVIRFFIFLSEGGVVSIV